MHLYLIRHAEAANPELYAHDQDRPLTSLGRDQAVILGRALLERDFKIDLVLSSKLIRACQTAEGLLSVLSAAGFATIHATERHLAPGASCKRLAAALDPQPFTNIALIGHEPDLGRLAAWLIGSRRAQIRFDKATIACIEVVERPISKGCGELLWIVPPVWQSPSTCTEAEDTN
jgi:phosphohistidine phosphatase